MPIRGLDAGVLLHSLILLMILMSYSDMGISNDTNGHRVIWYGVRIIWYLQIKDKTNCNLIRPSIYISEKPWYFNASVFIYLGACNISKFFLHRQYSGYSQIHLLNQLFAELIRIHIFLDALNNVDSVNIGCHNSTVIRNVFLVAVGKKSG